MGLLGSGLLPGSLVEIVKGTLPPSDRTLLGERKEALKKDGKSTTLTVPKEL